MTSDDELMIAIRDGSTEAFEQLFERYRTAVWQFFRRRTADRGRAEELAQDTFVAVLDGARRYEPRGSFRAFLFGVAYKVLMADHRKARHRRTERLDVDRSAASPDLDVALWVRAALEQLGASDREVLMLREYEQLSYDEIAAVRQIPLNTVRSQLFRARMAMREALQAHAPATVRTRHGD